MKKIGGVFPYVNLMEKPNEYLRGQTTENGELKFFMSGRCGIYYALLDHKQTTDNLTAYVPIYTCETVLAPFKKAGYELLFYDFDRDMKPKFDPSVLDRISIISICGYFGFSTYDREFVAECKRRGIAVIEDTTHSIFSTDGVDPHCDYIAGSFRKWLGVPCGGFAIKTNGKFTVPTLPPNEEHINWRNELYTLRTNNPSPATPEEAAALQSQSDELFWKSELVDFVILQQDAFDAIDALCPIERQSYMLDLVLGICDKEFKFEDYEQCRNFFKELINLLRQMNYSEFKSEKFETYRQKLTNLLNNGN